MAKEASNDKENIKNEEDKELEEKQEEIQEEKQEEKQEKQEESIDDMRKRMKTLKQESEELNSQLLRLQADFVNYRNRANKEKENSIAYGTEIIVSELLPVIGNFNRALEAEEAKDDSFYQGIKMIEKQLMEVLEKNSVTEIEALGAEFDPNYHHAVVMEESEEHESNIVIEVLQKGYLLKDKVIRPSMVKVSK